MAIIPSSCSYSLTNSAIFVWNPDDLLANKGIYIKQRKIGYKFLFTIDTKYGKGKIESQNRKRLKFVTCQVQLLSWQSFVLVLAV